MSCIKTGARVFFPDYGMATVTDLYAVADDTVLVVLNGDPRKHQDNYVKSPPKGTTHIIDLNPPRVSEVRFDRNWILVRAECVREVS